MGLEDREYKPDFICQYPPLASEITVKISKNLTLLEERQLREISARATSNMFDNYQRVKQQVLKDKETTDSDMLAFTTCSACGALLNAIKSGTFDRPLSGSVTSELLCSNEKCSFYLKIIPVNKVTELTNITFIPQMTFATESYLKEHPERKRNMKDDTT